MVRDTHYSTSKIVSSRSFRRQFIKMLFLLHFLAYSQGALADAPTALADAPTALEDAPMALADAPMALADAPRGSLRKNLSKRKTGISVKAARTMRAIKVPKIAKNTKLTPLQETHRWLCKVHSTYENYDLDRIANLERQDCSLNPYHKHLLFD